VAHTNQKSCSDADFVSLYESHGPAELHRRTGTDLANIHRRRRGLERKLGREIMPPPHLMGSGRSGLKAKKFHPGQEILKVDNGIVLVGSDAHYWPNIVTTAHRAFVHFAKLWGRKGVLKAVIMNGDVLDGSGISRHPPIGWEDRPQLVQEIDACKERLGEIENVKANAKLFWTLGNHDARFETRLAQVAPEYAKVHGVHLQDHFPYWQPCWSLWINDSVVIKHRWKGGIHATHNNTVNSGKTIVTGHLHSLKVTPFSDYNGTRWGIDTGTLADPYGPQFVDYCEGSPVSWRSGFIVLTFKDGELLWPEIVYVHSENVVGFRGEVIEV